MMKNWSYILTVFTAVCATTGWAFFFGQWFGGGHDSQCQKVKEYADVMSLAAGPCVSDTEVWYSLRALLERSRYCLEAAVHKIAGAISHSNDLSCKCNPYFPKQQGKPLGDPYDHTSTCLYWDNSCKELIHYFYSSTGQGSERSTCQTQNHIWPLLSSVGKPFNIDLLTAIVYHLGDTFHNGNEDICSCVSYSSLTTSAPLLPTSTIAPQPTTTDMKTTTPLVTTTMPQTKTTSNAVQTADLAYSNLTHCSKYQAVFDMASSVVVSHPDASLCTSGQRASSEAYVLVNCDVKAPPEWHKGVKLMENCERVPHYTPVAKFGAVYGGDAWADFSGIFIGCTDNGFKMAAQTCDSEAVVVYVEGSGQGLKDPHEYFVIQ